ncbi:hypothetical protein CCY99_05285 [Helicobacter sp. 16-1353]|uniref:YhdP family protein n=1 Tax=Helicobacter sp. 16-1353 TaxID=2004996 RepID=UPI000DCB8620|nr:AsmA-like C-terminal domain-containing protein [Helicobacter sp. 16-1353]RAX54094.1 hypothetical protein CCY99_05285 [Helicobacter sp. 16-1353]
MIKNKATFRKTYSKIAVLLIIILLFLLIFKTLSDGIRINSLSIAGIKIDGLYLKLDKKLVLDIDNIDLGVIQIAKDSAPPSIADIANIVRRAIWVTSFFEHLDISNIQYANESSSIYFDGNQYKINIPYVLAAFKLKNDGDDIFLDIDTLKVKKEELDIKGRILYLKKGNIFAFDLESYINNRLDNTITFQGQTDFKHLNIVLDSTMLNSIDVLAPYIKVLDTNVYEWIYKKAKFDSVTINRAYLDIKNIQSNDIGKKIIDNLYASGLVENVSLKIEDELSPIVTKQVAIIFDKGKLSFKTHNASYDGVIVDSGQVDISNFVEKQLLLELNLTAKHAILDERILGILNYYGINIPVTQKDGFGDGFINLDILLPTHELGVVVKPNGFFKVVDSNIKVSGVDLFVKDANIYIEEDSVLIVDSYARFKDILDTKVDIMVDTLNKKIDLVANPSYFKLSDEKTADILDFSNQTINAKMDFSGDDFLVDFANYDIHIKANDSINVDINNISKILPYSPILKLLDINSGNIKLSIKDIENINLRATIENLNYPIYRLDGSKITAININGSITKDTISLNDSNHQIESSIDINSGDIELKAHNVAVDINEILDSKIPIFANMTNDSNDNETKSYTNILINGTNIIIKLFGYNIHLDDGMLKTTQNGFISNGKNKNGIANLILDNGVMDIDANNFNDEFVNKMFNNEIVAGGTFGLVGIYKDSKFLGDITMANTSIKNMASLQNMLSFIDAIPSLVVFKLPGFSTSGYEVDNATIRIGINNEFIALENININGSSVDIDGEGVIDLKTKELNIDLSLSTMKSLSSILNKIPIIGYVLLGDDGKITTEVKVSGKIEDPKMELSLLEDTAKAPVNIIKRIFSPFQLLVDELKKESEEKGNR